MGAIRAFARYFTRRAQAPAKDRGEAAFRILAENSADVIFHFGLDLKARYISPSSLQLLGWTPKEIMATGSEANASDLIHPEDRPLVGAGLARHLAGDVDELKLDFRMIRRDGTAVWVETNCRTVRDPATGRPSDLILTMRDVSHKKAREEELSLLARTDGLTGLANRRAFDETLKREWSRALRSAAPLSLLVIDADHFKIFNDCNGHQVGDDCLRTIAKTLGELFIRPSDLVARYGGEEFAVILPDANQGGALHVAEEARVAIADLRISNRGRDLIARDMTVSIGVATAVAAVGGTMKMPEGLLQAADHALYRAKALGRNRTEAALLLSPSHSEPRAAA
jgi:diguanylate cyclase (GGDEF)-like protein/PAS domain S-box-containing protein